MERWPVGQPPLNAHRRRHGAATRGALTRGGAAHRAQADALEIEAGAKRRLADEYDAAQDRGEVAKGRPKSILAGNTFQPTADDIAPGFSKDIHEARLIRDAELADPGIVRRALNEKLNQGEEPTKASLRAVVTEAAMRGLRGARREPIYLAAFPLALAGQP